MAVITIRGQTGSGVEEIGKALADKLQADYVDKEIILQIAKRLRSSKQEISQKEMPPGTILGRIAEVLAKTYLVNPTTLDTSLSIWEVPLDDGSYIAALESVIKELAKNQPIIIRGKGSQFILKDYLGSFHILIVAPIELRVKRVMQSLKLDEESSKKEIERVDSSRREFTKRYFKAELEDPMHYDLVINTQKINTETSVFLILDTLRNLSDRSSPRRNSQ